MCVYVWAGETEERTDGNEILATPSRVKGKKAGETGQQIDQIGGGMLKNTWTKSK